MLLLFVPQDGRIDYNEFVAMMQNGNPLIGPGKKVLQKYRTTSASDSGRL